MHQEPYPQQQPPTQPAPAQTSVVAIGSLVASILGLTALPTVGSVIGLVLGYVARGEIRRNPALTGEGLATAGIVLGWIGVAVSLIGLILVALVIIFGFAVVPGVRLCPILARGF